MSIEIRPIVKETDVVLMGAGIMERYAGHDP